MADLVRGIDVSNYQPRDIGALIDRHAAAHVVVRLPLPVERDYPTLRAIALAQIASVRANGSSLGGYFWGYRDEDGGQSVRWAHQVLDAARASVPVLWADLEETLNPPGPAWLRAAVREARAQGVRLGAYTSLEWIRSHFPGGEDAFAEFAGQIELWLADWDGRASLDPELPKGFARLWGKQYTDTPLDLDVFAPEAAGLADGGTMPPSADVDELNQFSRANYDTYAEYVAIDGAACSAASLAAVLNHYGLQANISEGLRRIRATGDDVTPALGLLNRLGQGEAIADALDAAEIQSSTHQWADVTRADVIEVIGSGRPIVAQMKKYLGSLGHFLVIDGLLPDGSGVLVADSNAGSGKRYSYTWQQFWNEQAGGVMIWPDSPPDIAPAPGGTNEDGEDMAKIAELEALVADFKAKQDSHLGAIAYLADTIGDRAVALVARPPTADSLKEAAAISDEAQRVRVQFVGPRPAA